jgi:hypothetical protein
MMNCGVWPEKAKAKGRTAGRARFLRKAHDDNARAGRRMIDVPIPRPGFPAHRYFRKRGQEASCVDRISH